MNGGLYEESPPPVPPTQVSAQSSQQQQPQTATTPVTSPSSASASGANNPPATTASASSTSPSSVTSNGGTSSAVAPTAPSQGPLHIPAKRLTYDCPPEPGVIRHHGQPWSYENHHAAAAAAAAAFDPSHHHPQYNGPTYYNLPTDSASGGSAAAGAGTPVGSAGRESSSRKAAPAGLFWSTPSTEYKYPVSSAGPSAGNPSGDSSTCHQTSFTNSWCNYAPYSAPTRHHHHVDSHHQVPYLSAADDRRLASTLTAAETFSHDGYGLRNYPAPEPVPSTPYPPPGKQSAAFF